MFYLFIYFFIFIYLFIYLFILFIYLLFVDLLILFIYLLFIYLTEPGIGVTPRILRERYELGGARGISKYNKMAVAQFLGEYYSIVDLEVKGRKM
jgi:hypothetical protein